MWGEGGGEGEQGVTNSCNRRPVRTTPPPIASESVLNRQILRGRYYESTVFALKWTTMPSDIDVKYEYSYKVCIGMLNRHLTCTIVTLSAFLNIFRCCCECTGRGRPRT